MANSGKIIERGSDGIAFEAATPASQPGDIFPPGVILDYAGASAPTNWLICDGSAVTRTGATAALFAAIGTTYGAGDGSTTFNIPDLRGKIPVGKHTSGTFVTLGAAGGEENHTLAAGEIPVHGHSFTPAGTLNSVSAGTPAGTISTGGAHQHGHTSGGIFYSNGGTINDSIQTGTSGSFFDLRGAGATLTASAGSHNHTFTGSALGGHAHTFTGTAGTTGNAGSGSAHNNMPPYMVLNKIIKY